MALFNQPDQHLNSANHTDKMRILRMTLEGGTQIQNKGRGY